MEPEMYSPICIVYVKVKTKTRTQNCKDRSEINTIMNHDKLIKYIIEHTFIGHMSIFKFVFCYLKDVVRPTAKILQKSSLLPQYCT